MNKNSKTGSQPVNGQIFPKARIQAFGKLSFRNVLHKDNEDKTETLTIENSMSAPEKGSREVFFSREIYVEREDFMEIPVKKYFRLSPGQEVRLKGAYFITCDDVIKDASGKVVELHCTYDPATKSGSGFNERKPKGTIHWVDAKTAVDIPVRQYGYLAYPNEETGKSEFDPESRKDIVAKAEPAIKNAKAEERFQFFRNGYYIADAVLSKEGAPVFNEIVGLKSSWKKG
jgi:glutaminyl-tRNA synthetase